MTDTLQSLAAAMHGYAKHFGRQPCKPFVLDEVMIEKLCSVRAEIRKEEGGGGMCHLVTEWLQAEFGFERMNVTYLDPAGEVIFTGHVVSILQDGSVLDPTADQIGEGHDVRLLLPDDPEYGRYRPEFFEDFHPTHPDVTPGELDAWLPFWSGTIDYERADENRDRLGEGWWLEDKSALLAYYTEQIALDDGMLDFQSAWTKARVEALQAAISSMPTP